MRDWKKWSVGKWGWLEDLHSCHLENKGKDNAQPLIHGLHKVLLHFQSSHFIQFILNWIGYIRSDTQFLTWSNDEG